MRRATSAAALGLAAAALAFTAQAAPYHAPRNGFGQPDLSGGWSNATLTPQVRPSLYGTRRALTPEEVRLIEGASAAKDAAGRARSDTTAPAGSETNVGAYDRGWIDNGVGVMRVGGEPRTSLITTADGQPPPHRGQPPHVVPPGAGSRDAGLEAVKQAAQFDQFAAQGSEAAARFGSYDNPENRGVGERCLIGFGRNAGPPMFPNGWYNNNYLFAQGRDSVAIVVEMVHDVRVVRLNARHRTDDVRPWFGDSVGHWEGDTLVVETDHIPQAQAFDGAWQDLTITERFTRVAKDRLAYSFTVSAPSVWEKPWGGEYEFHPLKGQVYEYACHEGNYALPGILAGARSEERRAAAQSGQPGKVAGR
ncbi:MAG: hypothetical protein ACJ798_15610 [Phenylobacterium sp.]